MSSSKEELRNKLIDGKGVTNALEEENTQNLTHVNKNQEEIHRIAGRPPLVTLLVLAIGPLFSQVTSTLYGVINSLWIKKYIGEDGLGAVALEITFEGVCRSFGQFLAVAGGTQISSLFGKRNFAECEQVICDILRISMLAGLLCAAIVLPTNKPLSRWYGSDEQLINDGFKYILPQASFNFLTCGFLACTGFLQAEGRTTLIGIIDVLSMSFGMFCVCPVLMGPLKVGIWGPSWATIIADGVPCVLLIIYYFRGKFGVRPRLSGLIKPFSPYTFKGLTVGISQLVSQLALTVPGVIIRKLIGSSCSSDSEFTAAMASFNASVRFFSICNCVILASCSGYLPAASYSFASGNIKRYIRLSLHLNWVTFGWCLVTGIIGWVLPRQISQLFSEQDEVLDVCEKFVFNINCLNVLSFLRSTLMSILQSMQMGVRSIVVSILSTLLAVLAGVYILYLTDRHNPARLMFCYPISVIVGGVLASALMFSPFKYLWAHRKETGTGVYEVEIKASNDADSTISSNRCDGANEV